MSATRDKGSGSIFKHANSVYWQIAYMSGGKRRYESSRSKVKSVAQGLLNDRLGDIGKGIVVTPKVGRITLAQGLKAVTDDLAMNGRKGAICGTCKIVCGIEGHSSEAQRRIAPILKHFNPDRRMNSISMADIERYKAQRLEKKAAAATINRELATLRRAFRLAVRGGELHTMPHVALLRENNVRKGFFERDQFAAVLKHLPAQLHPPLRFAHLTGWRFGSEVLALTVDRVDLQAGFVRLDVGTTKSGDGRNFPITVELREVLAGQLKSIKKLKEQGIITPFVFHLNDGGELKIHRFRRPWRRACAAAGVPGKLLHDFRRTAARNLERAAVSRTSAMAMMGQKTESIYRRYAIADETSLLEGAAKLDAWAESQGRPSTRSKGQVKPFKRARAGRS